MSISTDLDGAGLLRALTLRASAEDALLRTDRPPSLVLVWINVVCCAGAFAFFAARPEPLFHAVMGGVAGAALSLGALSFGESRRLRRRLDAALVLCRGDGA